MKMMKESFDASSYKKRCELIIVDPHIPFILLASRGGEGNYELSMLNFGGGKMFL
jgi:hypothetical protein